MKKLLSAFAIMMMACALMACGGNKADSNSSSKSGKAASNHSYVNADYGYVVDFPDDFKAQNSDAEMEKDRGGKVFMRDGNFFYQVDVTAKEIDNPAEAVKNNYELQVALSGEDKIFEKEITENSWYVKTMDEFGYRTYGAIYKKDGDKGVRADIAITYPADKKDLYDKEADAIYKSFKFEK